MHVDTCTGILELNPSNVKSLTCPDCDMAVSQSKLKQHRGKGKCLQRQRIKKDRTVAESSMTSLRLTDSSGETSNNTGIWICPFCKQAKSSPQALGSHKKFCKVGYFF
jgi:hypothetical protein